MSRAGREDCNFSDKKNVEQTPWCGATSTAARPAHKYRPMASVRVKIETQSYIGVLKQMKLQNDMHAHAFVYLANGQIESASFARVRQPCGRSASCDARVLLKPTLENAATCYPVMQGNGPPMLIIHAHRRPGHGQWRTSCTGADAGMTHDAMTAWGSRQRTWHGGPPASTWCARGARAAAAEDSAQERAARRRVASEAAMDIDTPVFVLLLLRGAWRCMAVLAGVAAVCNSGGARALAGGAAALVMAKRQIEVMGSGLGGTRPHAQVHKTAAHATHTLARAQSWAFVAMMPGDWSNVAGCQADPRVFNYRSLRLKGSSGPDSDLDAAEQPDHNDYMAKMAELARLERKAAAADDFMQG
ncbi:hypothetical protein GGX14DRAFT_392659 [Mycena pura]|uniref:Uncharacterized protein n=1 Tax=Mycena pura TaxID=153505 RepID=A0AAD6VK29_9AGAR|nr:hypothetical protein GGX14DRAFT_392659 [Mycena pura]